MTYWIQRERVEVETILSKYRICQKYQVSPLKMPSMAPWPRNKLTKSTPFDNTGLGYFGPLYVGCDNEEKKKVWVCLFTCALVSL